MRTKLSKISGLTLIEILIAIVISSLMMAAMFTSYSIVNSTYRQVTDRAKISQAGRDVVGQMLREVRMAGFRYFNDNIAAHDSHVPIKITKRKGFQDAAGKDPARKEEVGCDTLEIVYGSVDYDSKQTDVDKRYTYTRYKIKYWCEASDKIENVNDQSRIEGFKVLKSFQKWNGTNFTAVVSAKDPSFNRLYEREQVLDYVQDMVFVPLDKDGKRIDADSSGKYSNTQVVPSQGKEFDVRTVDIGLIVRSTKPFYRDDTRAGAIRKIISLTSGRDISKQDRYLRDIITVTANARNVGLDK